MRLKSILTALALGLSTLSAPAAPSLAQAQDKPEPARVYKDWVVGCHWSCEAVVVWPEGDAEGYVLTMAMMGHREIEEDLYFTLHDPVGDVLQAAKGPYRLMVDSKVVATFTWDSDAELWTSSVKRRQSTTLANGKMGEIVDKSGTRVSFISLSGATAAMRDMDQRMGIVGYTHALVAKGKKQAKRSPSGGTYSIPAPLKTSLSATPSPSQIMDKAITLSGCADDRDVVDARFDSIHPLNRYQGDPDRALVLIGCGHGAYNYNAVAIIATKDKNGSWALELAKTLNSELGPDAPLPMLTNPTWNAQEETITHFNKGRGLGDCGDMAIYSWYDFANGFDISEIREMPVCRGATYWPAIW